jgi:stearoyl-CoA desaturase (Delta-9 desaturase)
MRELTTNNSTEIWSGINTWRLRMLLHLLIPYLGFIAVIWMVWHDGVSWVNLAILAIFLPLTSLGFTVGYHRLFAHHSFEAGDKVRVLLGILGLMGSHLTITEYVAIHRCHHSCSDAPGDPHSPHLQPGEGVVKILRGLFHSHTGWLFAKDLDLNGKMQKYASDLLADPVISKLDRLHHLWLLLGFVLPALLGWIVTHTYSGAIAGFVWGGLFRFFLRDQVESSVRGISHYFGKSPFKAEGVSTNHWTALLSMGEWHNNHHAFPNSAQHGLEPGQPDSSYLSILMLEKLGLAWNVKRVSQQMKEAKRV